MSARIKLTLLITAVGFFAVFFFSTVILWEMLNDEIDLVDDQLKNLSKWALTVNKMAGARTSEIQTRLEHLPYWIVISETASGQVLYRSEQAQHFELPHLPSHKGTLRHVPVPGTLGIKRDDEGCTDFRALCMVSHSGEFRICAARSLDTIQREFWRAVRNVFIAFTTFALVLLGTSYMAAALILRPLPILNRQAQTISENHLERRLPLTSTKDEFNALAATLNQFLDRLEYAFKQQKRLIANAAHELKTPLAIMRLTLYNMKMDIISNNEEKLSELVKQVMHMERQVKTLLDLSVLNITKDICLKRVELHELLASLAADYHIMAESAGITLYTELLEALVVLGDEDKLYRAFSNLLDNAIKYNHSGGEIHLTAQKTGLHVTVVLSNTGPSLPKEEEDKVFEPFYRGDKSREQEPGGVGLGLPIVKRIVELHNGRITFRGTPEGLVEVQVTLPAA